MANAEQTFREKAPKIMAQLIRDFPALTPLDAAAILGNLGHECAGFTALQEIKPTVAGSKGGYGWAQWTGPRRRAFEAYCKRTDKDPASDDANYAYLFLELKGIEGSEKTAIGKVVKSGQGTVPSIDAKVIAFERAYLRAGTPHYESRGHWARIALDEWRKTLSNGVPIPEPTQVSDPEMPVRPPVSAPTAAPGARSWVFAAAVVLVVMILFAALWVFGSAPAQAAAPVPVTRGAPQPSLWGEIAAQVAWAFAAPVAGLVASAAAGWVAYWWAKWFKTGFDEKSRDALQAALERGMLAALQEVGHRRALTPDGRTQLLTRTADYVQRWTGGTVKRFCLTSDELMELAVPHLPLPEEAVPATSRRRPVRVAS